MNVTKQAWFVVGMMMAMVTGSRAGNEPVAVRWLEEARPTFTLGSAWGIPWAEGNLQQGDPLTLRGKDGETIPLQTWTLATWPDGSVKWTGHAVGPLDPSRTDLEVVRPKGQPDNSLILLCRGDCVGRYRSCPDLSELSIQALDTM